MKFRPCIDIHNGRVKQIVGGTLKDSEDQAVTNFTSDLDAQWYARMYRESGLKGGHIILLNHPSSIHYRASKEQALSALVAYPKGLQIGGGVTAENGMEYLRAGASHVIVTSYAFVQGQFQEEKIKKLVKTVGKDHIVLDLSCRKKGDAYYVVTDRWQTFTDVCLTQEVLDTLSLYCDEFLIHGVDVEGKSSGMEVELVRMLAQWNKIPVTYAGGIGSVQDLEAFFVETQGKLNFTIGSGLDLFGGSIPYETVANL